MKIRHRKKGLFELRYTSNGKQLSIYGKTKIECLKKYREITKGKSLINSKSLLFSTWYEIWLDKYKKPFVKAQTLEKIKSNFKNYILDDIGNIAIKKVKTENIQNIVNKMTKFPRATTIIMQQLNSCFEKAVAVQTIQFNPCTAVVYHKTKGNVKNGLSKEQQELLLDYLHNKCSDEEFRNIILIYLNTGMRRNELLSIKYSDLDFDKLEIKVNGTKTKNSVRIIQTQLEILNLFPKKSKPFDNWSSSKINHKFKQMCDELGFFGITPHSLRHTFATNCIENGIDFNAIKSWLGHKDVYITMNRYVHISDEYKHEQSKRVKLKI